MMKSIIVLACALQVIYGLSTELKQQFYERMRQYGDQCVPEVGATQDDLSELVSYKYPSRHEGQCLIFCFYRKFGVMHEDGTIDREGSLRELEPLKADDPELYKKFLEIGEKCHVNTPKDDDKCVYAAELAKCAFLASKEMGLHDTILE